jgi:protein-disulfide isomerase
LETLPLLEAEYIETGKVNYVVHPYFLGDAGPMLAAEAAWCAQDQGKFFEYQHILYEKQQQAISGDQRFLIDSAAELGIERESFAQCLTSGTHRTDLQNARQAAASIGVNSTPTFVINNCLERNQPYPVLRTIIERWLLK